MHCSGDSLQGSKIVYLCRWQVGVSMVLSFMVVWDLPAISKGISSLQSSRLSAIYNEVAPSLAVFGMLFGKALQAQASPADFSHDFTCCSAFEIP